MRTISIAYYYAAFIAPLQPAEQIDLDPIEQLSPPLHTVRNHGQYEEQSARGNSVSRRYPGMRAFSHSMEYIPIATTTRERPSSPDLRDMTRGGVEIR